jgi:predicted transglutaminase-like cysteine proteinase
MKSPNTRSLLDSQHHCFAASSNLERHDNSKDVIELPQRLMRQGSRRTLVGLVSVLLLAVVCCRATRANEFAAQSDAIETRTKATSKAVRRNIALSRLPPIQETNDARRSIKSLAPPGFKGAEAPTTDMAAKWADLQSRIRSEEKTLTACREDSADCSPAARRLLEIVGLGRQHEGRARLGEINRAVNLSIRPLSDWAQYSVADFWSAPLATLSSGAGDCEDYVIVKYVALREAGVPANDLRVLIVDHAKRRTRHAVLAVRLGEKWIILDNLTMIMPDSIDARQYRPLFILDPREVMSPREYSGTASLS